MFDFALKNGTQVKHFDDFIEKIISVEYLETLANDGLRDGFLLRN
jgi:hypothetical protein